MKLILKTRHTMTCINNLYCDTWWPGSVCNSWKKF